ncbi:DUF1007 family protein [Taklimakanibacter lacteus]|uniref:DUF1007 family protein n=1 Tax=Taklimakanibacter lacteus TaxID=2268456 RepID=UPI000E66CF92
MRQSLVTAAMATAMSLLCAGQASAHPHVWISMRSYMVFNDKAEVSGIAVEWTFDDGYAQVALDGLDANGDGVYSQSELEPLTQENLKSLKDYNYFVVPRVDGKVVAITDPVDYGQIYSNGKLALHFTVPLSSPVDPKNAEFQYKIYDPEFFIAMDYVQDDPVGIVGSIPQGCRVAVKPVVSDQELDQTRQMLSTKGTDWKPPDDEDFGGLFAQPALVICDK